jgi:hypothetical protein
MRHLCFVLLFGCLFGCTAPKESYTRVQQSSPSETAPQYSDLRFWAAHPHKWDPSDSIPRPLRSEPRDTVADVFFIHPTTFTQKGLQGNAPLHDSALNNKTDQGSILFQATAFNQHARVFAPRYRQAHYSSFYLDSAQAIPLFDTAYADVQAAFAFYLQQHHHNRPIVIAAHSQGALLAIRLLHDFFDNKPLQNNLVAAYIIGWPVRRGAFAQIPVCSTPAQTGCFVSWRTFKEGYIPPYIQLEEGAAAVVNPLHWRTTTDAAPYGLNKGSVLRQFNTVVPQVADARIVPQGVLWVSKLRFPGAFLLNTSNYHIGDINLFYVNVRQNVGERIRAFVQQ